MALTKVTRGVLSTGIDDQSDATAITINSSEQVGIGATSPDTLLELSSAVGTGTSLLKLRNSSSAAVSNISQIDFEFDNSFSGVNVDVQIGAIKENAGNEESSFYINTTDGTGTPTERFRIDSSGNVGIGTTPSVHKFTVSDNTTGVLAANFVNSHSGGYGVNISAGNGTQYALRAENYAGGTLWQINGNGNMCHGFTSAVDGANYSTYSNNSNGIAIGSGAGSNQYRRIYHSASSGILTFKSSSNSPYLSNAGAWTNASDRAYKENIEDIEYGLSTVEALQPRKFDMIDDGSHEIGFIAQEVEELIPEVVIGEEGTKGVGYGQLTAVLTKAIQELKAELDAAKERITELENS